MREDLSYAWRSVIRTPAFAITVIATLAIGIGANAVMFTFLDRLFLRSPAGVRESGELRRLWTPTTNSQGERVFLQSTYYPAYTAIREAAGPVAELALYNTYNAMTLGRDRGGPPVHGVHATANYFRLLSVRPAIGRFFTEDEDVMGAGASVVVLSHAFWQTRLGGDTAVLGTTIALGPSRYTVVGIAEQSFVGLDVQAADVWMPLATVPYVTHSHDGSPAPPWWQTPSSPGSLRMIARMNSGFSDGELATRAAVALQRVYDGWNFRRKAEVLPGSIIEARGPRKLAAEARIGTRLGGVAAIVLIIAIANVTNLLLARATYRRRETAVRLALGISRARLVRLLATETLVLGLLAAAASLLVAWWGGNALRSLLLPDLEWVESALHTRVVLFTIGLGVLSGAIAGILPALQASKPQLRNELQAGSHRSGTRRPRLPMWLVVTQAALSVVLLVGATLFVRSLQNVRGLDIGFDLENVLHGSVQFWQGEAPSDSALALQVSQIAKSLETAPGVERVATSAFQPMGGGAIIKYFAGADSVFRFREDGPSLTTVSPGFFETVGLRFVRGSTFTGDAMAPTLEVIVNREMARLTWPGQEPIGQCIRFGRRDNPCYTVVGVVENARRSSLLEGSTPQYYLPLGTYDGMSLLSRSILVRARPDAQTIAATELRNAIRRAFPAGHAIVEEMTATLEVQHRPWRLGALLFGAFGLVAFLLAIVGVFSSISYGVSRRTHEFGVRAALGATVSDLLRLVIGEGVLVVSVGVVIGVALALAAGQLVASLLYGIEPGDPAVIVSVSLALLIVAALAASLPAWRAARVDPVIALRAE